MAIQNRPDMYSVGAVELNSQPSINFYAQMLQKKQAREEALDAYEMNRINRMNEQGVRDIDRPGLDAKVLDMKAYYQANKDKIRRGGTPEAYNYEKMFRETLAGVSKSKNATARAETFNKIRLERQKLGRNTPEDWFTDYQTHEDTPIWDEKFQELDLPKYMAQNTVKYDPKKTLDLFKDIKRTPLSPRYEAIQGDPYSKNEFIDEAFDKDAKMNIAARASDLYDNNDGFAMEVQQDYNNPVKRGELEKIAIQEFGVAPQSMSDYAAAKVLQQLQPKITGKPKTIVDWKARTDYLDKLKKENITLSNSQRNYFQQLNASQQGSYIDNVLRGYAEQANLNGGVFTPAQPIADKFAYKIAGKSLPASNFRLMPDGTTQYQVQTENGIETKTVTPEDMRETVRDVYSVKLPTPPAKNPLTVQDNKSNAYKSDTNPKNWKRDKDGNYIYIPTGQKVDAKGNLIK